jgi:phage gp46-like protein
MAFKDVVLVRNPQTGLWDLQKDSTNNPVADLSQTHAVLTCLLERRGSPGQAGWLWDSLSGSGTPGTHGSLLYLILQDTPDQRSLFAAYALDALQPLVAEGRITDPSAAVADSSVVKGRIDGVVGWLVPGLAVQQQLFVPLVFP